MSKRGSIHRQRLIISKLRRTPCSFDQLQDFLKYENEFSDDYLLCSQRTFQRDIKEIRDLYNIVIGYNHSLEAYEITEDGNEEHNERLMEAFEIYNALNRSAMLTNHVIIEKRKPLGTEHLHGLLHAIKNRREVDFRYLSYYDNTISDRTVQPVAVKEARNRWYLLGKDTKDDTFKSFGLDRIHDLEISKRKFEPLTAYDPEEDYKHSFGIINATGEKPERIELSFTPKEGNYIKSLPLHPSQKLLVENDEETRFEYELIPSYDFRMELLSYGDQVKVVKPESLKKKIAQQLEAALQNYK